MIIIGKGDDLVEVLEEIILSGYGDLPAVWALKLYLERN